MVRSLPSAPGTVTACVEQPDGIDTIGAGGGSETGPKKFGGSRCAQSQGTSFLNVLVISPDTAPDIGGATSTLGRPFDDPQKRPPVAGKKAPTLRPIR